MPRIDSNGLVTHSGTGYTQPFMDHIKELSDHSDAPQMQPLRPGRGVLNMKGQRQHQCECGGHAQQPTVNHGFTDEPLRIRKGVLS